MYLKKIILSFFFFLITVAIIFPQEIVLTEDEKTWLTEHPIIRLGVGTNFPPIQCVFEDNGEYRFSGIASDYLDILSELLGIDFRIEYGITFGQAMDMARIKEIDMFPCVAYSEERDEFLNFTDGYLENPLVIFSNDDAPFISSAADLSGLRVADVESLYAYRMLKEDIPGISFVLEENAEACLESVALGRADATVSGLISGSFLIRKNNWTNIKVAAPTSYPNTVFRMAVREDWPEFTSILNKALQTIDQGKRTEINQNWIAVRYEHGIRQEDVIQKILIVVAVAGALVLFILLWAFRLKREIRQRKDAENALHEREIQLQALVEEKEILIREVYHRVKNNLSLVGSIINMQASELENENDAEKMEMVKQRIESIILLNAKLSLAPDLKKINIFNYIEELIDGIEMTRTGALPEVKIQYKTVKALFDGKTIIPLGLIITELVTNALKYGFPDGGPGLIFINFEENENGFFVLTVENNGTPISGDIDFEKPKSLGLLLIHNFVMQLNGTLELIKEPSPKFVISFR